MVWRWDACIVGKAVALLPAVSPAFIERGRREAPVMS